MGLGIVFKLLPTEPVCQKHYACISSAVVNAMYMFPADQTIQSVTVDILDVICKQRLTPNAMLNHSPHNTVAHILAAMRMFAGDEDFQVRGVTVIKEVTASNWVKQLKPLYREDKRELVDDVWKETVENDLLRVMHTHKRSHKIVVNGCQALAYMAANNLHTLRHEDAQIDCQHCELDADVCCRQEFACLCHDACESARCAQFFAQQCWCSCAETAVFWQRWRGAA